MKLTRLSGLRETTKSCVLDLRTGVGSGHRKLVGATATIAPIASPLFESKSVVFVRH